MNFNINFLVIPAVIIYTAVVSNRNMQKGLGEWYHKLKKPKWSPPAGMLGSLWTFIFILLGFGVLWFWNIPAFSWFHYVTGVVLLACAYYNLRWTKTFFVQKDLPRAYKDIFRLNILNGVVFILIAIKSFIAIFLLLPYFAAIGFALYLIKEIVRHNK